MPFNFPGAQTKMNDLSITTATPGADQQGPLSTSTSARRCTIAPTPVASDRVTLSPSATQQAGACVQESEPVYARPVPGLAHPEAARLRADNLAALKDSLLQQYPDVRTQAGIAIGQRLLQAHYLELDPDRTF